MTVTREDVRGPRRGAPASRRHAVALAISAGLHAIVLSVLATRLAPRWTSEPPARPTLVIQLSARPAPVRRTVEPSPVASQTIIDRRPGVKARPRSPSAPSPLSGPTSRDARGASSASTPTISGVETAGAGEGRLPAAEMQPDLRGAVRAVIGCRDDGYLQLSAAEKRNCDAKMTEAFRAAPSIDVVPGDKRLAYGRAAAAGERKRSSFDGPMPQPVVPCPTDEVGSNLGASCLPTSAIHHFTPH